MYGSIYDTAIYRNTKGGSGSWESITPILNENEQTPFITPITMRFEKPWEIYTGTDRVWKTPDGGDTWVVLPTEVENGAWGSSTVGAIALTPADEDVLMVAKGNLVYSTHNGGETWRMSALGSALNVAISPHDANQAVACMASSASGITGIWRTLDGGVTWSPSGYGLPSFAVQVAAWDPTDPAVVFAGTDVGLYRSVDGGVNWQRFGQGLPAASVHDLRILPDGSMLKVATHGRGMWELVLDTVENQSPTIEITSHATNFTGNALGIVDLSASASDPDGDPLELSWIVADEWQITDGGSGVGTVESNVSIPLTGAGQYLIAAYVKDDKGGAAFDTISGLVFEPANDCATPRVIPGAGPFPVALATNNFTSVRAESDPDVPCIDDPDFPNAGAESTIWFEFTPVASGTYEVATCGSASDTVLTAWTGDACGPYTLVANGCNDDDEQVHCLGQRTDSYLELELEAGTTYRFMVGAYITQSTGKFRLQVNCEDCTPTVEEPEFRAIVPAVANAAGDAGTSWLTDLNIYNPGKQDAEVTLEYRATGAGSGGFLYGMDSRLAPESAAEFSNVLGETLETEGSGALLIESDHELIIASRTYNTSPDGTFGQFIPGVPSTRAVAPGDSARLIGLAENDSFRSNLGLANASAEEASVTIELYGADGTLLASRDESLAAFGSTQINRILDKENLDGQASVTALVHNTSEQASIVAYVSTVDATTGDPIYAGAADEATPHVPLWIAASAHADGAGTSVWRTDLELANTSDLPVQVTVEFFGPAPMTERPFAIVDLAASEAMMLPDVLSPMMESGAGALRISVNDGSLAVSSRTYNQTDNGTYGQYVPGQSESDAVTAGQRAVLTQLRQAENQFRTNVGVVNVSESPITVDALFFDVEGSYLGFRQFNLEPLEYEQKNGAVPAEGINGGFAILSSDSPGAAFLAYASVIDSGSDDPVFIPAVALSE